MGGVCNEYLINAESSTSEGYQQMSIIKIFFRFQTKFPHDSTHFKNLNLMKLYNFAPVKELFLVSPFEGIMSIKDRITSLIPFGK